MKRLLLFLLLCPFAANKLDDLWQEHVKSLVSRTRTFSRRHNLFFYRTMHVNLEKKYLIEEEL